MLANCFTSGEVALLCASCNSFISPMFDLIEAVMKLGTDDVDCEVSKRACRVLSIAPSPLLLSVSVEPLSLVGPQPAIKTSKTNAMTDVLIFLIIMVI
jgi:hypothetical protein